jgi:peptide-methionine (S)-S-oxide reductase
MRARPLRQGLRYYGGNQQQYLAKNPNGYRCHSNSGVKFPADA